MQTLAFAYTMECGNEMRIKFSLFFFQEKQDVLV